MSNVILMNNRTYHIREMFLFKKILSKAKQIKFSFKLQILKLFNAAIFENNFITNELALM